MQHSDNYNRLDRILHYLAFCSPVIQKVLSEVENDLFAKSYADIELKDEVFITGLPRAGTTLMLDLLYETGEFQSFTYREMPFILTPILWNKLSCSFRKEGRSQERAHGDGMEISVDSPEAFEEVIWLTYMGKKIVGSDRLSPVAPDDIDEDFVEAIRICIRKLLVLSHRARPDLRVQRYLSKNNANVSRIGALRTVFPTSKILIIFRHPLAHIGSLSKQHEQFLKVHESDRFSRNYMKWIGHYEFGGNFKPIDFGGWLDKSGLPTKVDESFWLKYWNAAYTHALQHKSDNVAFVDFNGLLDDGMGSLERIADSLKVEDKAALVEAGRKIRSPTTSPRGLGTCSQQDWERAQQIHDELVSIAI